jgi:hypothetical protein
MATFHFSAITTATPEQFIAAITDFGPGRSKIFPNSADSYLQVHDLGPTSADVTEGSAGVWERLSYDWSNPHMVVLQTTDSNAWGGRSGHSYRLTPQADGTTKVDATTIREGKNLKGKFFEFVFKTVGRNQLPKAFKTTIAAIDARYPGVKTPVATAA